MTAASSRKHGERRVLRLTAGLRETLNGLDQRKLDLPGHRHTPRLRPAARHRRAVSSLPGQPSQ
jgi:hypothetical protein